jgi:hypothetical protein
MRIQACSDRPAGLARTSPGRQRCGISRSGAFLPLGVTGFFDEGAGFPALARTVPSSTLSVLASLRLLIGLASSAVTSARSWFRGRPRKDAGGFCGLGLGTRWRWRASWSVCVGRDGFSFCPMAGILPLWVGLQGRIPGFCVESDGRHPPRRKVGLRLRGSAEAGSTLGIPGYRASRQMRLPPRRRQAARLFGWPAIAVFWREKAGRLGWGRLSAAARRPPLCVDGLTAPSTPRWAGLFHCAAKLDSRFPDSRGLA